MILSLETSTGCGSIALTKGTVLLAEATVQPVRTHSRRLLGTVSWIMQAAGVDWPEIAGIGVSLGPGSFTGLRIGLAAAKGMAMAANIPLIGVETMDALALSCTGSIDEQICPVLDARKQEVYTALYHAGNNTYPTRLSDDQALRPVMLVESIDRPTVVTGPAVSVYGELFKKNSFIRLLPASLTQPRALYIGLLAERQLKSGGLLDPATVQPKYVRASEAEIMLRRKNTKRENNWNENHDCT